MCFPYTYISDDAVMADIQRAIDEYSELTNGCIRFRPKTDADEDFVYFTSAFGGCFSDVGRTGGGQIINYQNPGCTERYYIHVLFKALAELKAAISAKMLVKCMYYNVGTAPFSMRCTMLSASSTSSPGLTVMTTS